MGKYSLTDKLKYVEYDKSSSQKSKKNLETSEIKIAGGWDVGLLQILEKETRKMDWIDSESIEYPGMIITGDLDLKKNSDLFYSDARNYGSKIGADIVIIRESMCNLNPNSLYLIILKGYKYKN